jgi:hypothetical protein
MTRKTIIQLPGGERARPVVIRPWGQEITAYLPVEPVRLVRSLGRGECSDMMLPVYQWNRTPALPTGWKLQAAYIHGLKRKGVDIHSREAYGECRVVFISPTVALS